MEENIMDGKIAILLVSIIAVGMFAVPSTLALYTGSHQFVNGSSVDCGKCHTSSMDDIAAELASGTAHYTMDCSNCHGYGNTNVDLDPVGIDGDAADGHAASMNVDCIGCHSGDGATSSSGITDENVLAELNLAGAAHHEVTFNDTAENHDIDDRDQACIACHTDVPVNITDASLSTTSGTIWIKGNSENLWDTDNWSSE